MFAFCVSRLVINSAPRIMMIVQSSVPSVFIFISKSVAGVRSGTEMQINISVRKGNDFWLSIAITWKMSST